jgi:hypothetical protein
MCDAMMRMIRQPVGSLFTDTFAALAFFAPASSAVTTTQRLAAPFAWSAKRIRAARCLSVEKNFPRAFFLADQERISPSAPAENPWRMMLR